LFRSTGPSEHLSEGFTLIEALAALAVASAGIAAIGSLLFSSARSDVDAERHMALIAAAQKILAGLPDRNDLTDGQLHGALDHHQWRIDTGRFAGASEAPATVWEPQHIALRVRSPGGAVLNIDTVRLRKRAAQ
jgi:general secretion pathway protein I